MDKVDKLYECYETLANNQENISEHEAEYLQILQAVKGENSEKLLACQFIPKFFKDFPHLTETALDAQLDLVEDEDVTIRKQAIKHLPSMCKGSNIHVSKIADILAQMLMCDDSSELAIVNTSLVTVLKLDVKGALAGLFTQIKSTEEEMVRKRAINFICAKLKFLPAEMMTKDVEEYILQECKEVFHNVSSEEFSSFMSMLSNLRAAKTLQGQQSMLEIVMSQVELDKEFNHENPDSIVRLLQCIRSALPFFSHYVSSSPFVKYIALQVLPMLKVLPKLEEVDIGLECIKAFAELSPFTNDLQEIDACLENVYKAMLDFVPLPPTEGIDNETLSSEPNFQFSHIEGLMYAFHQLLKKSPTFLTSENNSSRFKDLKVRLIFLARSIQGCIKTIRESLADKTAKPEETKLKTVALSTMTNINSLVKDLFHNPPTFKIVIVLSWKQTISSKRPTGDSVQSKRKEVMPPEGSPKQVKRGGKGSRELYSPPGGKYSSNVKYFPSRGFGTYRGSGRRGRPRYY